MARQVYAQINCDRNLYPFKSHFHPVRPGIRMHYIDEGRGTPIVMVHGNPTWSFYYRNLVKTLQPDFRIIVPDHIGCGLSDRPDDSEYAHTLTNRIDDLAALLEHCIGSQPFRLVIHDWGGMIGLGMALKWPERLQQLVVLNTAGFLLPDTRSFHNVLRFARTPVGGFLIRHFNAFVRGTLRWGSKTNAITPKIRKMYLAPYDSAANRLAVHRFVQDIPLQKHDAAYDAAFHIDQNLNRLKTVPKLVLWGRHDFVFDDAFLHEWQRRCPEATYHVYEEAGHLVMDDAAADVCQRVHTFFTDSSGEVYE